MRKEPYNLEKLFYSKGVDLIIQAHEHSYERLYPLFNGQYCQLQKWMIETCQELPFRCGVCVCVCACYLKPVHWFFQCTCKGWVVFVTKSSSLLFIRAVSIGHFLGAAYAYYSYPLLQLSCATNWMITTKPSYIIYIYN